MLLTTLRFRHTLFASLALLAATSGSRTALAQTAPPFPTITISDPVNGSDFFVGDGFTPSGISNQLDEPITVQVTFTNSNGGPGQTVDTRYLRTAPDTGEWMSVIGYTAQGPGTWKVEVWLTNAPTVRATSSGLVKVMEM